MRPWWGTVNRWMPWLQSTRTGLPSTNRRLTGCAPTTAAYGGWDRLQWWDGLVALLVTRNNQQAAGSCLLALYIASTFHAGPSPQAHPWRRPTASSHTTPPHPQHPYPQHTTLHGRRTRGDGNCFFRAFLFGYLEHLLLSGDAAECARVLARLEAMKRSLVEVGGYDEIGELLPLSCSYSVLCFNVHERRVPVESGVGAMTRYASLVLFGCFFNMFVGRTGALMVLQMAGLTHPSVRHASLPACSAGDASGHGAADAAQRGRPAGPADGGGAGEQRAGRGHQVDRVWWWWCVVVVVLSRSGTVCGGGERRKPGGPLTVTFQSQEGACCAVHQPATPASPCGPPHLLLPISSSALLLARLPSSQQPLCVAAAHADLQLPSLCVLICHLPCRLPLCP